MDAEPLDLRTALQALAAEARRDLTSHPEPEVLVAYRAGELSEAAAEALRDHLALCPDCADLLLDLDGFSDLEPPVAMPAITDRQVEAALSEVRTSLTGDRKLHGKAKDRSYRPFGPPGLGYALAASLVACLGLSIWVAVLLSRSPASTSPPTPAAVEAGGPLVEQIPNLELREPTRGEPLEEFHLGDAREFTIGFDAPNIASPYWTQILRLGHPDRLIWEGQGVSHDVVHLKIRSKALTSGEYRLRLSPARGETPIAEYSMLIAIP